MDKEAIIKSLRQEVAGQCAFQKLRAATRMVTRRYDEVMKPLGLKSNQFTMLTVITLVENKTLTELADILSTERSTVIRNLRPLERDGYITMTGSGQGKAHQAEITDKGLKILGDYMPLWRKAQEDLKKDLGEEDWNNVHKSLAALGHITL